MKKVLFLMSSMNIGGVEKSLLSLLSAMPKKDYEITVLLLEKKGGFLEFIPEWVKLEESSWYQKVKPIITQPPQKSLRNYLENKQLIKAFLFLFTYLWSKYFNDRYLFYKHVMKEAPETQDRYDLAITYQGPTDILDYYLANKVNSDKKISWVHFDIKKHLINEKLYTKIYKEMDKVFVVSSLAKNNLIEKIPTVKGKSEVFLNIISHDLIVDLSKEKVEFDTDFDGIKIVTVGRLSLEKGQDIAIKVLARLIQNGYKVRWYCIGDGNARNLYEALIKDLKLKDDFLLLGAKSNPYPYMAAADIYIQTSRHEGYCLTLAEAKSLNKPIITTDFIGAFEQIEDGINGYIVKPKEDELYQKTTMLIKDSADRERIRKNLLKDNKMDTTSEVEKLISYIS